MTPKEKRRFYKQLNEKIEQERNWPDKPVDPEISQRMTKPVDRPVYQCYVLVAGVPTPVGPSLDNKPVIEEFAAAIRTQIAAGKERTWSEPLVVRI